MKKESSEVRDSDKFLGLECLPCRVLHPTSIHVTLRYVTLRLVTLLTALLPLFSTSDF